MPNCFQLLDKETNTPVSLALVDNLICREVYNTEPDKHFYGGNVFNWFDSIGFQIAMGKDLAQTREYYVNSTMWFDELPHILPVIDYLEQKYTTRSFYSTKH